MPYEPLIFKRGRGRQIGFHPKKGKPYNRRRNPNKARSKAITWTPDHDNIVEECLANWLAPLEREKLKARGGPSMVVSTGMALLRQYLRWLRENGLKHSAETVPQFFETTEYAKAVSWFISLQGDIYGKDKYRVLHNIYGDLARDACEEHPA